MPPRLQRMPPNQYPYYQHPPMPSNRIVGGMPRGLYQQGHAAQGMNRQLPGRGGFLSRLLGGRKNQAIRSMQQPMNPFQFGSGIGIQEQTGMRSILNADSISKFLGQTQQVLRTGQQIGSMVHQYGPLVRNLPALWKIYRGFQNNDPDESEDSNESEGEEVKLDKEQIDKEQVDINVSASNDNQSSNDNREEINRDIDEHVPTKAKTTEKKKHNKENKLRESVPKLYI